MFPAGSHVHPALVSWDRSTLIITNYSLFFVLGRSSTWDDSHSFPQQQYDFDTRVSALIRWLMGSWRCQKLDHTIWGQSLKREWRLKRSNPPHWTHYSGNPSRVKVSRPRFSANDVATCFPWKFSWSMKVKSALGFKANLGRRHNWLISDPPGISETQE